MAEVSRQVYTDHPVSEGGRLAAQQIPPSTEGSTPASATGYGSLPAEEYRPLLGSTHHIAVVTGAARCGRPSAEFWIHQCRRRMPERRRQLVGEPDLPVLRSMIGCVCSSRPWPSPPITQLESPTDDRGIPNAATQAGKGGEASAVGTGRNHGARLARRSPR